MAKCYRADCSEDAVTQCQQCGRFTCREHGGMSNEEWMCEDHYDRKGDMETHYDIAKMTYENYLKRRTRLGDRAFEMIRVSGMITSILGAVSLFALINYPSHYLILLLPGLIVLLTSILIYLPIWKVPNFKIIDLEKMEDSYNKGELTKSKAAKKLIDITRWYRNELIPPVRKKVELQNKLTKFGIVISISGILLVFALELLLG